MALESNKYIDNLIEEYSVKTFWTIYYTGILYSVYCKPFITELLRKDIILILDLDISDEFPSEYLEYYTLTDHL